MMVTTDQIVYWLDSNYCIQNGTVVAVNARKTIDGMPKHVVVEIGEDFVMFSNNAWESKYWLSPHDAMADGVARLTNAGKANSDAFGRLMASIKAYTDKASAQ